MGKRHWAAGLCTDGIALPKVKYLLRRVTISSLTITLFNDTFSKGTHESLRKSRISFFLRNKVIIREKYSKVAKVSSAQFFGESPIYGLSNKTSLVYSSRNGHVTVNGQNRIGEFSKHVHH